MAFPRVPGGSRPGSIRTIAAKFATAHVLTLETPAGPGFAFERRLAAIRAVLGDLGPLWRAAHDTVPAPAAVPAAAL